MAVQFGYIVQPYHLIVFAAFFLCTIAVLILYVSFYLRGRKKKSAIRHRLKLQYSEIIGQLIIAETEEQLHATVNTRLNGLRKWLTHPFARKIFIDELFRASQMISGDAAENIIWAYNHFQLETDTQKNLQSKYWNVVAKAMQRLAALNQRKNITRIYRFTNSGNNHIREQAQAAVVKLTGFEGLRFLDITNRPIEKWQQLCLLHELSYHTGYDETQIKKWLQSGNASVVTFALILVQTYQCYALHDDVMACMEHKDIAVKEQALITLKEIAESNTATVLITYFSSCEPAIQLQILQVLRTIGTENEIAFLENMLQHPDNLFKLSAVRALKNIEQNRLEVMQHQTAFSENPWPQILAQLEEEAA